MKELITLPNGKLQAHDTDTTVRITFERGRFNESQKVTSDLLPIDLFRMPSAINELAAWLIAEHPEALQPYEPDTATAEGMRIDISRRIKEIRTEAGLSIGQLANKAGLHKNAVWRFEQGEGCTVDTLCALCLALGIKINLTSELS